MDPDVPGGELIGSFDGVETLAARLAGAGGEEGPAGGGVGKALPGRFERRFAVRGRRIGQQEKAEDQDFGLSSSETRCSSRLPRQVKDSVWLPGIMASGPSAVRSSTSR